MKKIIAFAIGLFSVTAIFAQSRNHNDRYGNYNGSGNVVERNHDSHNNGYGYNSNNGYHSGNGYRSNNGYDSQNGYHNYNNYPSQRDNRYNDQRRTEMDRINHDYDRRIDKYRRDRSINTYERDRRIQQAQSERGEKLKSFAGGAVVGAIAGVILGTVLSH